MTSRKHLAWWFALLVTWLPSTSHADDPPDFEGFKNLFYDRVSAPLDAQIADAKAKAEDPNAPADARAKWAEAQNELETLKRRVEDVKTVEALYGSVKGGYDAIKQIAEEADAKYNASSALHVGKATVDEINKLSSLQSLADKTSKGIDIGLKLKALHDDLEALETSELSPGAKRLSKSLTVMTKLMSEFGGKVPMIGDFIKEYGNVGGELLKVTVALDGKIKAQEGGQMIDGVHGDRGNMLDLLRKMPGDYNDASRLSGLRDVFRTNTNDLVIWDPKARNWVKSAVDEAELRRRYLYYAKKGIKNPSPETLLQQYRASVEVWLKASKDNITPGETITLTPTATRISDDGDVSSAYVTVALAHHSGIGSGTFSEPTTVRVGTAVSWTAPNNNNETYRFEAKLDDATKKTFTEARAGNAWVRTGDATKLNLKVTPSTVGFGGDVSIEATVTGSDGAPLPADAAGEIEVTVTPPGGTLGNRAGLASGKGVRQVWTAPAKTGRYTVSARYRGSDATRWFGSNTAGSEATASIEVQAARYGFTVSPAQQTVKKDETANFEVVLTNEDQVAIDFALRGRSDPPEQRRYWRLARDWQNRLTLEPGASHTFKFGLTPTDAEQAKSLRISLSAAPKGVDDGKSVAFEASMAGGDKLLVRVATSEKQGKARAGNQDQLSGEYAPGDTIKLTFRPWGERREFCAKTVIEKNRNMRQVEVFDSSPNGCSYGTRDGRLRSTWSSEPDEVTWSGPHVTAGSPPNTATFVVPAEPGTYTIKAQGQTVWKLRRKTAVGSASDKKNDRGSATFTIVVAAPE